MDATSPGRFEASYSNWVKRGMRVPEGLKDTIVGDDPGFVRAAAAGGDFHLASGSACIDAGAARDDGMPALEYRHPSAFTFRRNDEKVDIGAFEAVGEKGR